MENGEAQTEYTGIAAEFARAKAEREKLEAKGLRDSSANSKELNKRKETEFGAKHFLLVCLFLWLLFIQLLGILLFASGFLLSRIVLEDTSICTEPPLELESKHVPSYEAGCWHPKVFNKAVVILVDALRYDFTVPYTPGDSEGGPRHYHNALSVFHEMASQRPHNSFLLPFIADPPTTTLQRLKALTTGTLPTFVDAGSNFAATAVDEDNLVTQLRNARKSIVHLGDDTWHALFPGSFEPNLTKPYDSFNVWDLHTVDNGVSEHLFTLLDPSMKGRWDVIFGHYLGVDHAGHRYGPDHPAMNAKLQQMDDVFRRLVKTIDDDTLLVVLGDHGMDAKGDHGGESADEVEAALWMYAKKPVFGRSEEAFIQPPRTGKERPVAQIDLVPTLSLLLGLPIPFNNLGGPIEEAFIGKSGFQWENFARVNRITASQIGRYMDEYSQIRGFDTDAFAHAGSSWTAATTAWSTTENIGGQLNDWYAGLSWKGVALQFQETQRLTLETCRSLWARFDLTAMMHGVEILAGSLVALIIYAGGITGDRTELTPILLVRSVIGSLAGGGLGAIASYLFGPHMAQTVMYSTAMGGLLGLGAAFWYARRRISSALPTSFWSWIPIMFPVALSIGFASNSYTIWEDQILLVLVVSSGALFLISSIGQSTLTKRAVGCYHSVLFAVLARVASFSRLCREEQTPHCKSTFYGRATSSTSATWTLLIPCALSLLLPNIIRAYYDTTQSYHSSAVLWIGLAFRIGLVLTAVFWSLDAADNNDWIPMDKETLKSIKTFVAQTVVAIAFAAGYSTFVYAAPFLNIRTTARDKAEADGVSTKLDEETIAADSGRTAITILGYNNVHGARFFPLVTIWALAIIVLSKPIGQGTIGVLVWQILCLLEITAANPNLRTTAAGPIALALLGSYHFFKTGHNATFASIQWDAVFIPLKAVRYPWAPLFIALNSFGAQILCCVAVPLTQLWKVPPKKPGLMGDVARAMAQHVLFYAVIVLATTMWAGHLRRHLMLYRVFMPRYLMAALIGVMVQMVGALVAIGGLRWSFLSVGEVFGWS